MHKLMYLLWAPHGQHPDVFCERLLDDLRPLSRRFGVRTAVLHTRDSDARVRSPSPGCTGRAPFDAMLSLTVPDLRTRGGIETVLEASAAQVHGYLAEET